MQRITGFDLGIILLSGMLVSVISLPQTVRADGGNVYTIGGAIYDDCANPHLNGIGSVIVGVTCNGGFSDTATTAVDGLWSMDNVPEDTCTVTATGYCNVDMVCPPTLCEASVDIDVNTANQGPNQSIQFYPGVGTVYTIGGAIYDDCANPHLNGIAGVTVDVTCDGGFSDTAMTAVDGLWSMDNVPEDTCTVTATEYCNVDLVCPPTLCEASVDIDVNTANQGPNQSIQFYPGVGTVYTIGGAIYDDCANPHLNGIESVTVSVICNGGFSDTATTAVDGLWSMDNVPEDTCTVTATGYCNVDSVCPPTLCAASVDIDVNTANQGPNQSIQFYPDDGGTVFTIGGAIYDDCANPHLNGIGSVTIDVTCDGGFSGTATTAADGLWSMVVPEDTCTVTATGYCNVDMVCPPTLCAASVDIDVNTANQGPNQSIQFFQSDDVYTIGGAIYDDCTNPHLNGIASVTVDVTCDSGFTDTATTAVDGLWSMDNVPEDTCTVTATGYCNVDLVCPPTLCAASVDIDVNTANQGPNQSIQFYHQGPCSVAADCDDGNQCTDDACDAGTCVFTPNDANCPDDGKFCNGTESCDLQQGCVSSGDPCTGQNETCNESEDKCDTCTPNCAGKVCGANGCGGSCGTCTAPATCNSGGVCVPCVIECTGRECGSDGCAGSCGTCLNGQTCEPTTGSCVSCTDDIGCDDSDVCNGLETCDDGVCFDGSPLECDDENACTDDSCDPTTGCAFTPDETNTCNDSSFCNGFETCVSGQCENGIPPCALDADCCEDSESCDVECCDDDDCSDCDECNNGVCTSECDDGQDCDDSFCVRPCDGDEDCVGRMVCELQVCVKLEFTDGGGEPTPGQPVPPICNADGDCIDPAHTCVDGACLTPCVAGIDCGDNESCEDGFCWEACSASVQCPENQICDDGGACIEGCTDDSICDDGEFCNGIEECVDGTCQPGDAPCSTNQMCDEIENCCQIRTPSLCGPGAWVCLMIGSLGWLGIRLSKPGRHRRRGD